VSPLLEVSELCVSFDGAGRVLDGASYAVDAGSTLGIVGEQGSGKTVALLATLGLIHAEAGSVNFEGRDLLTLPPRELRLLRGGQVGLILGDALHPSYRVGAQLAEAIQTHRRVSRSAARDRAIDLLELVGIPDPHERVDRYPHELSDAMRRRATIAIAIASEPKLLLADEPAAGLDVTARAEVLTLLEDLRRRLQAGMVIASREEAIAAEIADDVRVLSQGRIVDR
jgi:ABC-type glutathione transport system ATPase component